MRKGKILIIDKINYDTDISALLSDERLYQIMVYRLRLYKKLSNI